MPFRFPTPINTPSGDMPFAALTLVVSPNFTVTGVEAQVVLKAEPYNIVDGAVVRPTVRVPCEQEDGSTIDVDAVDTRYDMSVVYGEAYADAATDPALAKALGTMAAALQGFITSGALING